MPLRTPWQAAGVPNRSFRRARTTQKTEFLARKTRKENYRREGREERKEEVDKEFQCVAPTDRARLPVTGVKLLTATTTKCDAHAKTRRTRRQRPDNEEREARVGRSPDDLISLLLPLLCCCSANGVLARASRETNPLIYLTPAARPCVATDSVDSLRVHAPRAAHPRHPQTQ